MASIVKEAKVRYTTNGADALTDKELVALLVEDDRLTVKLFQKYKTLKNISNTTKQELELIVPKNIARRLTTAFLLSSRIGNTKLAKQIVIPSDVVEVMSPLLANKMQEELWVISLNTKMEILDKAMVYKGSVNTLPTRIAEILRRPIVLGATSIIVVHNHPSGDATPSPEDVAATKQIVKASKIFDIQVNDHIIIGANGRYTSLKERGLGFNG